MEISEEAKRRASGYMALKKSVVARASRTQAIKDRLKKESIKDIKNDSRCPQKKGSWTM